MDNSVNHLGIEERYSLSSDCTDRELLSVVKIYAREIVRQHSLDVSVSNLEWEISHRARRRAGALYHSNGQPKKIQIARRYFDNSGWLAVTGTVRHELIHAHLLNTGQEYGHSEKFKRLAKELDTRIHCDVFSDPKYWIVCADCEQRIPRYKKSKLVKNPEQFQCGECGGQFQVIVNTE